MKRLFCLFLCLMLLCGTAMAEMPQPIYPLDYDSLPEPVAGQHHYLLCCTDTWEGSASNLGNTDGILLVTLDTVAHRVMITTLTREMLVQRPDGEIGRITFIAKRYGPEELCRVVSTHFGVKVDKYILFSMDDVQTIIEAMGGVYITVTNAEADYLNRYRIARDATTPSMNKAGTYLFGGHAAVIYMRIRKVGGDGDSGRTRRIRTVLSTLSQKYADASLADALSLLETVMGHMITTNMTTADLVDGVGYAMQLRGVAVEGLQLPADEDMTPITYAGMMTREVNFDAARECLKNFLEGDSYAVVD